MSRTLDYFKEICAIPHGSYNIDAISDYLVDFAKKHDLKYRQDELKNVIIFKDASEGYENEKGIILQGHMDMVAVKTSDCKKDMTKEGLDLMEEDGYLFAKDTTLGGDDGIAIAYALEILESDTIRHPKLECIFTVNEEVGMDGAVGIDLSDITGRYMINVDSEGEGVITTSCAGGVRMLSLLETKKSKDIHGKVYSVEFKGLKGGHSGTSIHEGRANACIVLGRLLKEINKAGTTDIIDISGGEKDNAIPASAKAMICTDVSDEKFVEVISVFDEKLTEEYKGIDDDIQIVVTPIVADNSCASCASKNTCGSAGSSENKVSDPTDAAIPGATDECHIKCLDKSSDIIEILNEVPDGVVKMSELNDLVETSLNLGVMSLDDEGFKLDFLLRSSIKESKEALKERLGTILAGHGCRLALTGDYPGWAYDPDSVLTGRVADTYKKLFGKDAIVTGVHAGLECGILLEKKNDLDVISIGPNILNIHTTEEKLDLESVERVRKLLLEVLSQKA